MIEILQHDTFKNWLDSIKDAKAKAAIQVRINRFKLGLLGDVKPIGKGVSEARIFVGKGYRLYFIKQGDEIVVLLCGGTKSNKKAQQEDIQKAINLASELDRCNDE